MIRPKKRLILGLAAMAALALLTGILWNLEYSSAPPSAPGNVPQHSGEEDAHEPVVQMTDAELSEFGIELEKAGPGELKRYATLPGEIVLNADRLAHVVPRVAGIVREVRKDLGDPVTDGEVMAVIESRELADAKAAYLAARERLFLARAVFKRETRLWEKGISSEQEYLDARKAEAEARIEVRRLEQKLHALGLDERRVANLPSQPDTSLTRYEISAPFAGTVIRKHIALGEAVQADTDVFEVADLKSVWVDLTVYPKDLGSIREGQEALVSLGDGSSYRSGRIGYVGPVLGESTRTALARVVLSNPDGTLRPGMFITARVLLETTLVPIRAPKAALQTIKGKTSVFVRTSRGLEPRAVTVGRDDETYVEITAGLTPGETYVSKNPFILKAQLMKSAFQGHGH